MHRLFSIIFSLLLVCVENTATATGNQLAAVGGRGDDNKCLDKERLDLLQFKSGLQDPYHHGCLSTWTADEEDCCYWNGVTCLIQTGHVIKLEINECGLVGKISHSLLNLTYLNYLDLSDNSIHGTIPKFLGSMTQLTYLDLSYNSFSGTVPPEFGNLTNLQVLGLADVGRCRVENIEWLSRLSHLLEFYMSGISLAKANHWVDVILSLRKLSWLGLDGCELSQVMHPYSSSFLNSSSSIEVLYLVNNNLNSSMYPWLFPLTTNNLWFLDLSSNMLDGIPRYLGNLCSLTSLYLNNNSAVVEFPVFLNNLSGCTSLALQVLEVSYSHLTGPFTEEIQKFPSLAFLDLFHNFLSGPVPECLWHFKELTVLNLGNNNLFGRLPNSDKSLINLEVLDLYNNEFSGELPLSLQNCTNLTVLDLGANKFSGNVPIWIGENLSWLYVLILSSNKLVGTIPLQLCQLANLQILDLSMNNLHGTIPSCVNNLTAMVQEGPVEYQNQHEYGTPAAFVYGIYFDHAMIGWQGVEREFFSNLKLLKMIDLSSNKLTGQIPYELTNLSELIALNLSKNALHGEIPQMIGQMKNLLALDLSRNSFSGGIPSSMSQMTFISYLDMSYNNLSGRIPSSTQLQSFDSLRYDGNVGLCGLPLSQKCPGDEKPEVPSAVGRSEGDEEDKDEDWGGFYIGVGTGFATGFWIVCGTLLFNRRGRHVFFNFYDSFKDWVYVKVVVFIASLKKDEHR